MTAALVSKEATQEDVNVKLLEFYVTPNAIMTIHVKINKYLNINLIFVLSVVILYYKISILNICCT